MNLIKAYGSTINRKATGLVTCPCCRKRRQRRCSWHYLHDYDIDDNILVCPTCSDKILNKRLWWTTFPQRINTNGWGVFGNMLNYNFRSYFLLTRNSMFGDIFSLYMYMRGEKTSVEN